MGSVTCDANTSLLSWQMYYIAPATPITGERDQLAARAVFDVYS